jgi:hypothetical protein
VAVERRTADVQCRDQRAGETTSIDRPATRLNQVGPGWIGAIGAFSRIC